MPSTVVGIGDHLVIDSANKRGRAFDAQPKARLGDRSGVGLERCCEMSVGRVARKGEKEVPDALRAYSKFQLGIVNRIGKRGVAEFQQSSGHEG
jgi:hypothetical protein